MKLSSCDRDWLACKAKNIIYPFTEKSLSIPGLEQAGNGIHWRTADNSVFPETKALAYRLTGEVKG